MEKEFDVISRSFFLAHTNYPISNKKICTHAKFLLPLRQKCPILH